MTVVLPQSPVGQPVHAGGAVNAFVVVAVQPAPNCAVTLYIVALDVKPVRVTDCVPDEPKVVVIVCGVAPGALLLTVRVVPEALTQLTFTVRL